MGGDWYCHNWPPDIKSWKLQDAPKLWDTHQKLKALGLRDPWLRNYVWVYEGIPLSHSLIKNSVSLLHGFPLAFGLMAVTIIIAKTFDILQYKPNFIQIIKRSKLKNIKMPFDKDANNIIKEGNSCIELCNGAFYNPVQEFNRDISSLIIKNFITNKKKNNSNNHDKKIKLLDAMSATGLRGIRYATEINEIDEIIVNDISPHVKDTIQKNIDRNDVSDRVKISINDAKLVMLQNINTFDVIDLDPYGTAAPFLDSAVQSISDGGLICVTCTDTSVLVGNTPETCYAYYGSVSHKTPYFNESCLRILLQSINNHANRYGKFIEPLLSISVDFYVRVFVKIHHGAQKVKKSILKLSRVVSCVQCHSFEFIPLVSLDVSNKSLRKNVKPENQIKNKYRPSIVNINENCLICGGRKKLWGPIWNDKIHNYEFVSGLLKFVEELDEDNPYRTLKRIYGTLSLVSEELQNCPFYFTIRDIFSKTKLASIPIKFLNSCILNAGYHVSLFHACPESIKTDAPFFFIWTMMKKLLLENDVTSKNIDLPKFNFMKIILNSKFNVPIDSINFNIHPKVVPVSQEKKLLRWQHNPLPNWGPKSKQKKTH
ncbi:hypothetical protein A3Q56_02436 [Intoshia linei]|uniref:tRNA (guanine(26)-N(2))-dimethyltransferase n=1 Tax=Intoshia linei TaxID=1819745 RepID=A0A177B6Q6_9BILA|nr:hypothetical protein A3Q56_02436 [Intoshia linei]